VSTLRLNLGHAVNCVRLQSKSRDQTGEDRGGRCKPPGSPRLSHTRLGSADPFRGGVQVLITGRHGFKRTVRFAIDEDPAVIRERVRETLEAE
jgi:hypothetical protein